jgi:hypothetical protein
MCVWSSSSGRAGIWEKAWRQVREKVPTAADAAETNPLRVIDRNLPSYMGVNADMESSRGRICEALQDQTTGADGTKLHVPAYNRIQNNRTIGKKLPRFANCLVEQIK